MRYSNPETLAAMRRLLNDPALIWDAAPEDASLSKISELLARWMKGGRRPTQQQRADIKLIVNSLL